MFCVHLTAFKGWNLRQELLEEEYEAAGVRSHSLNGQEEELEGQEAYEAGMESKCCFRFTSKAYTMSRELF